MIKFIFPMVAVEGADAGITRYAVTNGLAREGNPLMAPLVEDWTFIPIKLLGAVVAGYLLYRIYRRHKRIGIGAMLVCIGGYLAIIANNLVLVL